MAWKLVVRALTAGGALWVVAFLVAALVRVLGIGAQSFPALVVLLLAALYVTWFAASRMLCVSVSQGLMVGLLWVLVNALLDTLVIVSGINGGDVGFFQLWAVRGRYLLLLVLPPLLASRRRGS